MMKKGVKLLVNTLIYLIFGLLILIIIAKVNMLVTGKDYFEMFGYSFFNVATGSMEPAIKQNDFIIVKKTKDFKVNDIVTFYKDESYITHRVVSIDGSTIVTKGDANNTNDFAIGKDMVIGKVIKIISHAGIWQKIFTTPGVILSIFLTLICFDFAFSYKGFNKKKIKKEEENEKEIKKDKKVKKIKKEEKITTKSIQEKENEMSDEVIDKLKEVADSNKYTNEYTIGLNLEDIQKRIDEKINEGEK